jgi:magnesium-transporting ATPase (P-type)
LIAILQSIPVVSPLTPTTAILPLAFVIAVSMIREAYEDYQRYKSDSETNKAPIIVLKNNKFQSIRSDQV